MLGAIVTPLEALQTERLEMALKIEIRRNADGAMATFFDIYANKMWWIDGNGECDCNRELYFLRARNELEPEDTECSNGRFSIRIRDDNDNVLYDELKDSNMPEPKESERE